MVLKAAELVNEYDVAFAEIGRFIERGDVKKADLARIRQEAIIKNLDKLTEGTRLGRRETARALSIGRMRINRESFQLAPVILRAQASKRGRLTLDEKGKFEELVVKHTELKDKLAQAEAAYEKILAETDRLTAEKMIRPPRKRVKKFETIFTERTAIKSQLTELGFRLNDLSGLTAEGSYLVGKLAVTYIKEGVASLAEVVRRVQNDIPDVSARDVHQSLVARDPKRLARARSETTKRITDIKSQADLLLKIERAEQGIFDKPKGKQPRIPEIRALQRQLNELRQLAYKTELSSTRLERAFKTLGELQDQLDFHYRPLRKPQPLTPAELASIKEKIAEVRKQMRIEDEIVILKEQLRTGEFIINEPKTLKELPPDIRRAQVELNLHRRKVRAAIDEMAPLGFKGGFSEFINTLRTIKATADMSATLRQGMILSATRPVVATKALGQSIKAFFSERSAESIDLAIRSADHHYIREKSGLELTELGGRRTAREELFGAQMIERVKVLGPIVKASNRHMTSQLNLLRTSVFDEFLTKNPNATHAELTAYADWVNIATGRGNIGRSAAVATTLSTVFFAPRFAWSRVQTPLAVFKNWKQPRVRKAIAKDLAGFLGIGLTTLALADMAGFDVGTDPRDSDWGKIRIGDTRIDIFAGVQQPLRVMARIPLRGTDIAGLTGKDLDERYKKMAPLDIILRFGMYKAAPFITLAQTPFTGRDIVGQPTTLSQTLARAITPLWLEDAWEAFQEEGLGRAGLVGGLTFFGVGATTFPDSEAQTRKKIAKLLYQFRDQEAKILKDNWNALHPEKGKRISKVTAINR